MTARTRLRREQPHAFYALTPPMSREQARRVGVRVMPAFVCCEQEAFEMEGGGHDGWCPTFPQRPALKCAVSHPLLPDLLCGRLSGHGGLHACSDVDTEWTTEEDG